ncbi:hypothetical protein LOD99_14977 [Oopsacas minuta]|uniref:Uncharacterized protein n=1 Tax=Oopsacas minuta TaxID=111878 RepID=A0AAV7KG33_9METZ|nr:hypothetical protein LOD99_14977 [Oopsacas minuta]
METPLGTGIIVSPTLAHTTKGAKSVPQSKFKSTRALPSKPLFFLGEGNNCELIQAIMEEMGWERSENRERFKLKWVQVKSSITFKEFKEGIQIVNHFPNMELIGNKRNLAESLREYSRIQFRFNPTKPITLNEFLPETFILDSPREKEEFLKTIHSEGSMWICKPTHRNQGQGIFLIRGPSEVESKLATPQPQTNTYKGVRKLVQRYIMNPLLLEDRKFDIRVYMLIIAAKPYLVFYHSGYIRLSCVPFVLENEDMHTHLTNQFIQKQHPSYQEVKETTVWSFEKFQQYIDEFYTEAKQLPPRWVFTTMTKKIQVIMQICFSSIMRKLHHRIGYFELLGFDFMVDTDFKVWLIEVNVNPALHTNCSDLLDVIPNIVRNSIILSLEVFDKCIKHKPILPLNLKSPFIPIYKGR